MRYWHRGIGVAVLPVQPFVPQRLTVQPEATGCAPSEPHSAFVPPSGNDWKKETLNEQKTQDMLSTHTDRQTMVQAVIYTWKPPLLLCFPSVKNGSKSLVVELIDWLIYWVIDQLHWLINWSVDFNDLTHWLIEWLISMTFTQYTWSNDWLNPWRCADTLVRIIAYVVLSSFSCRILRSCSLLASVLWICAIRSCRLVIAFDWPDSETLRAWT